MRFPRAIGIQLGLLGLVSALLLAVACGPAATPTPTPAPTPTATTVAPLPAATPTATAAMPQATPTPTPTPTRAAAPPTATPTPTPAPIASPTPTPVAVPAPKVKAGTIFVAVPGIDIGVGLNRSGTSDTLLYWSGGEAFMRPSGYDYVTPSLAVAWKVAPDLSKVTLTLRQGVQFHKGWGEMTAEDAVWSFNDANGAVTKESIHGQAGDFAPIFGAAKVVSKYEMDISVTNFDPRWDSNFLNHAGQALSILSKRLYDEKGADYARENIVATGPFQVREWRVADKVVFEAFDKHWRKVPQVKELRFIQIVEESSRVAGMMTGELDAALLAPANQAKLAQAGFTHYDTGMAFQQGIFFSGNLWEDNHALTGEKLSRDPLLRELQWIGNPLAPNDADNPAGMTDMEQARLVRTALAMAYDRDAINKAVLSGLGWPAHVMSFDMKNPNWQKKWEYPYDPAQAEKLLDQAGYKKGAGGVRFEMPLFVQTTSPANYQLGDAVAGYWANIGVQTPVLKYSFTIFRPGLVARANTVPYLTQGDEGMTSIPYDWPHGTTLTSMTRGGFSAGMELPKVVEIFRKTSKEPDAQKRLAANLELAQYYYDQALNPGVVVVPKPVTVNPKSIKAWPMHMSAFSEINSPEEIVLAR